MRCPFGANGTWRFLEVVLEVVLEAELETVATVGATWDLTQV